MVEPAAPRGPRRFDGKPIAIGLAIFMVVGTALTTYFSWRNELALQRAADAADRGDSAPAP